jgi:hypothetical protein
LAEVEEMLRAINAWKILLTPMDEIKEPKGSE